MDVQWWLEFAREFNSKEKIIFPNYGEGFVFSSDSCLQGYGLMSGTDWQAGYFNSSDLPASIEKCEQSHQHWINVEVCEERKMNYLELVPVWLALDRYADVWRDSHVLCLSDNTQVVAMLRKGHSVNKSCMELLRRIFWICVKNNIYVMLDTYQGS